ncbi:MULTISPECIES: DUF6894 family protein [Methylobacterium]|uniref:DUF6894 family protein n=1 Tax=Methylobacterium TaxID=407 RepID=UPI001050567F|nr:MULTISPECIES: hypothetical protein [Methylobacterium]MDR7038082.1 hypothetical protein [Methylobacterium sp. BE186]
MRRIYFDLTDGFTVLSDETGVVVGDLDEALRQAMTAIEEMRLSGQLRGGNRWRIVVRDANRTVLHLLPLR